MSKYQPLETFLAGRADRELPMTFAEVEALLGFSLPPSARAHPQWWSNNLGSHVAVRAWRGVGWRTSRVDLGGERVVFVREDRVAGPSPAAPQDSANDEDLGDITLAGSALYPEVQVLIGQTMKTEGLSPEAAISHLLLEVVRRRRREILDWFVANQGKVLNASDSVDLIREDRDRDEY